MHEIQIIDTVRYVTYAIWLIILEFKIKNPIMLQALSIYKFRIPWMQKGGQFTQWFHVYPLVMASWVNKYYSVGKTKRNVVDLGWEGPRKTLSARVLLYFHPLKYILFQSSRFSPLYQSLLHPSSCIPTDGVES